MRTKWAFFRGPSVDASYQVSVHLAKRFQRRRIFRNPPIRNKNCLWRPCFLIDSDEMSKLYRGPSIDASYQVSDHLAQRFQRRRFLEIDHLFRPDPLTNMAVAGHSCFWLADFKNSSLLKPIGQMNLNLVGNIYGRSSIKIAHFIRIH
jgi:hypothetical protein